MVAATLWRLAQDADSAHRRPPRRRLRPPRPHRLPRVRQTQQVYRYKASSGPAHPMHAHPMHAHPSLALVPRALLPRACIRRWSCATPRSRRSCAEWPLVVCRVSGIPCRCSGGGGDDGGGTGPAARVSCHQQTGTGWSTGGGGQPLPCLRCPSCAAATEAVAAAAASR